MMKLLGVWIGVFVLCLSGCSVGDSHRLINDQSDDGVVKSKELLWGYSRDGQYVYDNDGNKIQGVDAKTFEMMNTDFWSNQVLHAKDKNNVYFNVSKGIALVLTGADVDTFERVGSYYAKDKNHVYYISDIITGADSQTFEMIDKKYYAKDKNSVYLYGEKVVGDVATFEVLSENYTKDKDAVYVGGEYVLRGFDVSTFEVIDENYVKDKKSVYYIVWDDFVAIDGVDIESFVVLGGGYVKDKNYVYYRQDYGEHIVVDSADLETFVVHHGSRFDAKDKNGSFSEGRRIKQSGEHGAMGNDLRDIRNALDMYAVDHAGVYPKGVFTKSELYEGVLAPYVGGLKGVEHSAYYVNFDGEVVGLLGFLYYSDGEKGFIAMPDGTKEYTRDHYVFDSKNPINVEGRIVVNIE